MERLNIVTLALFTLIIYFAISQTSMPTGRASQNWQGFDIGAPGIAGSETSNGAQLTVTGSGNGVGASPAGGEQGRFSYQTYSGDIEIVARVTSLSGGPKSQAGLMLRESGSDLAFMACAIYQSPAAPTANTSAPKATIFQRSRRTGLPDNAAAYNTNYGTSPPASPPLWLKLVRVGQNYATYRSTNGREWTPVQNYSGGSFTTSGSFLAGFFVSGGGNNVLATAVFDSIYIGLPRLEYRTSWVGNNYSNDADRYVSANLSALYVAPDGRNYTNGPYDEAGEAAKVYGSDGRVLRAISGTSQNSCAGGHCVYRGSITGDSQHLFLLERPLVDSATGKGYDHVRRTDLNGGFGISINLTTKTIIGGMAAGNGELYLADTLNDRILVVNTATLAEITGRSFPFTRPGPMTIDGRGNLWIIQRATDQLGDMVKYPAAIRCFRLDGTFTGQEITDVVDPKAVAIDPAQDRLLVAEAGPAQNIRFYSLGGLAPVFSGTFGVAGGVFSGPTPGLINDAANGGWQRLYSPNGVGMDTQGNLYVSCSGIGSHLRKFDPQGNLLWSLSGLSGVEAPAFDPVSDGQDLFSFRGHFALDYTMTAPGAEWRYAGLSQNLLAPIGQALPAGENTVIRRLGPNQQRLMFTAPAKGMAGDLPIRFYRYKGELAIPAGSVGNVKHTNLFRLWVDKNGDGIETVDERTEISSGLGIYSPAFDVDAQGNIYILAMAPIRAIESAGASYLRVIRCLGLSQSGVPIYNLDSGGYEDLRNPFDLAFVYNFRYDAVNDAMFFIGFTYDLVHKLVRYDNWSTANRRLRFRRTLPRPSGETPATAEDNANFLYFLPYAETPDFQQPGDINCGVPPCKGGFFYFAMDVAGDKVFLGELWGPIHVYDANFGNQVTRLLPGPEVSGAAGWTDVYMGVRAFRRSTGEYVIVRGDASIRARNLMFRWTPATPTASPDAPINLRAEGGADRITLTWEGGWGLTSKYTVWRGTSSGGETLYADNLTGPLFTDNNVQFGTKYYYRVTAVNEAGSSGFSNEVSATANTAATFSHFDVLTEGNWKGVYGQEGYDIVGDSSFFPTSIKYATNNFDSSRKPTATNSPYLPATVINRGTIANPEYPMLAASAERIYAVWRNSQVRIDFNLTDGLEHQVALYFVNSSGLNGQSIAEVFDRYGNLLDRRTLASAYDGRYAVWKMSGQVQIVVTFGNPVADVAAVFVDPISARPATCSTGSPVTFVTVQPESVNACTKQTITFNVQATGQNLSYQWRLNKEPIAGATGQSFTIPSLQLQHWGRYDVVITGACGTDISATAFVPLPEQPRTLQNPTNQTVNEGESATFTASYLAGRPEPTTPQWQVSTDGGVTFTNIPGGTPVVPIQAGFASTLTLSSVSSIQNGYRYRAVFTNPCGVRETNAATLTVIPAAKPVPVMSTAAASGVYGGNTSLTATLTANGSPVVGKSVSFSLNGSNAGTAITDANGVAALTGVSLSGIDAGTHTNAVQASFAGDANYQASSSLANLIVNKATVAITLSNLNHIYDGTGKSATFTLNPAGVPVTVTYSQHGFAVSSPVNTGSYDVAATISDANYQGDATGTLVITRAKAVITLSNLLQQYDGGPKPVTLVTSPPGLSGLSVSYAGSSAVPSNAGSYQVLASLSNPNYTAIDATGTLIINAAPVVNAGSYSVVEGGAVALAATATDREGGALSYVWDLDNDGVFETTGQGATFSAAHLDGPSMATVKVRVSDTQGGVTLVQTIIPITNAAPVITSLLGPIAPVQIGTTASLMGQFTDAGTRDAHTALWSWDDGGQPTTGTVTETSGSGTANIQRTFTQTGVYEIALQITDKDGAVVATSYKYVVVYDPTGGFVTGGGWITSPAGALRTNLAATGKATFGFVSKYQKGATVPTGQTEFQFQAGDFRFSSTSYEWLVVAGAKAQYKGVGKVNGAGEYGFLLTATDGQVNGGGGADKFRIKIWEKATGTIIYDNVFEASDDIDAAKPQVISGGSIVIHSNK